MTPKAKSFISDHFGNSGFEMTSSPVSISLWFRGGLGPGQHGRIAREPSQPTGRSIVYSRSSGLNSSQNSMPPVTPWNPFNLEGSCRDWTWGVLKATGPQQGGDRGMEGSLGLELGSSPPLTQLRATGQGRTSRLWSGPEPCTDARTLRPAASPCHPSLPCTRSPQSQPEVPLRVVRSPLHALRIAGVEHLPKHNHGPPSALGWHRVPHFMSTWNLRVGPRFRKRSLQM